MLEHADNHWLARYTRVGTTTMARPDRTRRSVLEVADTFRRQATSSGVGGTCRGGFEPSRMAARVSHVQKPALWPFP